MKKELPEPNIVICGPKPEFTCPELKCGTRVQRRHSSGFARHTRECPRALRVGSSLSALFLTLFWGRELQTALLSQPGSQEEGWKGVKRWEGYRMHSIQESPAVWGLQATDIYINKQRRK